MINLVNWWPLGALLFSMLAAGIIGFNHRFKVDGRALTVGRITGVAPLALASLLMLPWPTEPGFYIAALGMGLLLTLGDILLFDAAAKYGGRQAGLYVPVKVYVAFVAWAVVSGVWPANDVLVVVSVCFAVSGWALMHIRKHDGEWRGFKAVLPVAFIYALGDVVAKAALPVPQTDDLAVILGGVCAYLMMTNVSAAAYGLARGRISFNRRDLMVASAFGAYLYLSVAVLLVTIALAPNPGYVGAITMLSTVWLALWGRYRHGEDTNFAACLLLAASGIVVALAVA